MNVIKKILFFLLMPIYISMSLLVNSTYGWWSSKSETNPFIFFLLMPFYAPFAVFLNGTFEWWVSLSE